MMTRRLSRLTAGPRPSVIERVIKQSQKKAAASVLNAAANRARAKEPCSR